MYDQVLNFSIVTKSWVALRIAVLLNVKFSECCLISSFL